jgi:uncharacterized protein YaiI (UPF0178 family)
MAATSGQEIEDAIICCLVIFHLKSYLGGENSLSVQFLVDENLSKSDKFLKEHPEFVNVKHLMTPGVKDDAIIERARLGNFIIVTKDIKLALNALIGGLRVWYFDAEKNIDFKLTCQQIGELG